MVSNQGKMRGRSKGLLRMKNLNRGQELVSSFYNRIAEKIPYAVWKDEWSNYYAMRKYFVKTIY